VGFLRLDIFTEAAEFGFFGWPRGRYVMCVEVRVRLNSQNRQKAGGAIGSSSLRSARFACFCGFIISLLLNTHTSLLAETTQWLMPARELRVHAKGISSKREVDVSIAQEQSGDYALPADPKAVVLSLEYGGGFPMPQQKDFKPTPFVRIQADGTLITGGASPRAIVTEMKLTGTELQSLLQGIIAEDKLLEIKPGEIDEAIKATGERIMVADAPTTTLNVKLADKEFQLRQYASRMVKSQFPQVEALQRFVRSENRLHKLHAIALLGGSKSVREMLAAVNEAIGAKSADWPTMDLDCLQSAQRESNGKLFATWERTGTIAGQAKRLTVWVEVDERGQRKIEFGEPRDPRP
jgi:hypothetical protein